MKDALFGDLNTTFRGTHLFSGTHVGRGGLRGSAAPDTLIKGTRRPCRSRSIAAGWCTVTYNGQAVAQGSDAVDVLTAMEDSAVAIETGDDAGMGQGADALDRAFDRALRLQGRLGADERGVDAATARLSSLRLATETAGQSRGRQHGRSHRAAE